MFRPSRHLPVPLGKAFIKSSLEWVQLVPGDKQSERDLRTPSATSTIEQRAEDINLEAGNFPGRGTCH